MEYIQSRNLNHSSIFIEVAIMMMFMDIWPSYLSLGLDDDLFQPFIMYGDDYKYI